MTRETIQPPQQRLGVPVHTFNGLLAALGLVIFGFEVEHSSPSMAQTVAGETVGGLPAQPLDGADAEALSRDMPEALVITASGDTLNLRGHVAPGDAARVARAIVARRAAGEPVHTATISSTGGSMHESLAIGRLLRRNGIATELPPDAICYSACPYLFAGGTERSAAPGARFGVHQDTLGADPQIGAAQATAEVQTGTAQVMSYLHQMGVGLDLLEPALATPPERMHFLSSQELSTSHLVTNRLRG